MGQRSNTQRNITTVNPPFLGYSKTCDEGTLVGMSKLHVLLTKMYYHWIVPATRGHLSCRDMTEVSLVTGFTVLLYVVKPDFKGHSDERTPCDQGKFSQNGGLSSPMSMDLRWRDTCHVGTLSLEYWDVPWRQVLLHIQCSKTTNLLTDMRLCLCCERAFFSPCRIWTDLKWFCTLVDSLGPSSSHNCRNNT